MTEMDSPMGITDEATISITVAYCPACDRMISLEADGQRYRKHPSKSFAYSCPNSGQPPQDNPT